MHLAVARMYKAQWGCRLAQRVVRGHLVRKQHGGRLAEIRARRKEEEKRKRKGAG